MSGNEPWLFIGYRLCFSAELRMLVYYRMKLRLMMNNGMTLVWSWLCGMETYCVLNAMRCAMLFVSYSTVCCLAPQSDLTSLQLEYCSLAVKKLNEFPLNWVRLLYLTFIPKTVRFCWQRAQSCCRCKSRGQFHANFAKVKQMNWINNQCNLLYFQWPFSNDSHSVVYSMSIQRIIALSL